jgi:hypothetical protein
LWSQKFKKLISLCHCPQSLSKLYDLHHYESLDDWCWVWSTGILCVEVV